MTTQPGFPAAAWAMTPVAPEPVPPLRPAHKMAMSTPWSIDLSSLMLFWAASAPFMGSLAVPMPLEPIWTLWETDWLARLMKSVSTP